MDDDKIYIECSCSSKDHVICVSLCTWEWKGVKETDLSIDTQMRPWQSFLNRVRTAFKYIFSSTPCKYGYWNNTILSIEDAKRIAGLCNRCISMRTEELKQIEYKAKQTALQKESCV